MEAIRRSIFPVLAGHELLMVGDAQKKEFFDVLRASAPLGPTPGGHREIGLNEPNTVVGNGMLHDYRQRYHFTHVPLNFAKQFTLLNVHLTPTTNQQLITSTSK